MRRSQRVVLIALSVVAFATEARAEAGGVAVAFSFDACPDALGPAVERIARLELHAASGDDDATTRIEVTCDRDDAALHVHDPLTGKTVERTVSLAGEDARVRPRLLALAIAELARSSWIELDFQPTPTLPVRERVDVPAERKEQARATAAATLPPKRGHWHGHVALEALLVPRTGQPLPGLSLGVERDVRGSLFVEADLSAWDGVVDRTTGSVFVRQAAFDPSIGVRAGIVEGAIGARVVWTSLSGSGTANGFHGGDVAGWVVAPHVTSSVALVGPVRAWLKAGWLTKSTRGAVASDSDVVVGGPYASLGLGLRFGSRATE